MKMTESKKMPRIDTLVTFFVVALDVVLYVVLLVPGGQNVYPRDSLYLEALTVASLLVAFYWTYEYTKLGISLIPYLRNVKNGYAIETTLFILTPVLTVLNTILVLFLKGPSRVGWLLILTGGGVLRYKGNKSWVGWVLAFVGFCLLILPN